MDEDRRDSAALQERHYTRLLPEGCASHPPATTSTPFGAPSPDCAFFALENEGEFFRRMSVIRQQLSHLLDRMDRGDTAASGDIATASQLAILYHALQDAGESVHGWQNLHGGDRDLLKRAERELQRTGALFRIRYGLN